MRKAWQGWGEASEEKVGGAPALNEKQRVTLAYTDAMTIAIKVSKEIFDRLQRSFGEGEIVEITATVAAYNCVSRFLVALDVGETSDKGMTT